LILPIHSVLDDLLLAIRRNDAVVLAAPPGAGKTTVVPLALLDQDWMDSLRILLLEPRRIAARAAADRMAASLGESAGQTVGYRTRLQSRIGPSTRIEVVTEGVFTRMILDDPGLEGIGAVLFDEFHERSLDADLGLALARDSQAVLRPDLRILVMSATLDTGGLSRLLADKSGLPAPIIETSGRQFDVDTRYLGRSSAEPLEVAVTRAVRQAIQDEPGSVLVFLPGQAEIRRTHRLLVEQLGRADIDIVSLYGALDKAEQDRAIEPSPQGRRKVVLATSVAETSLTIEGVRVVVDSGLSRVPRFDPSSGLTRLVTVRLSKSSAQQRMGRAGRTAPGICYRLWDEEQTRGLVANQNPEIKEADLTGFALDLARWGARSVEGLAFLDPPPAGALSEARRVLSQLGALDPGGCLGEHGHRLARMPLSPRLAHMVTLAADEGDARTGARVAALLAEPGLGGLDLDLAERLRGFERDPSMRARDARHLADRWARMAGGARKAEPAQPVDPGRLIAASFPERIARARGKPGEFLLSSGRGAFLDPTSPLARETWLAVAEMGGGFAKTGQDQIRLAARLDPVHVETMIEEKDVLVREPSGRMNVRRLRQVGALVIDRVLIGPADRGAITAALRAEFCRDGITALKWGQRSSALRARLAFMGSLEDEWPDVSDQGLMGSAETWLLPLLEQVQSIAEISDSLLDGGLRALLSWDQLRRLDQQAPERFVTPLGTAAIDYGAEGGPRVDIRVQELFGVNVHPAVASGRVPLTLALLSPARRPLQITKDLPRFWSGSWAAVRAEMRGRYPRHPWPEAPAEAPPTTRVKPRGS